MKFLIDKQTINDLDIFDRTKGEKSVISLFKHTISKGGEEKLKDFFNYPINDITTLKKRVEIIKFFELNTNFIEIDRIQLDLVEFYLVQDKKPTRLSVPDIVRKSIDSWIKPSNKSYIISRGTHYLVDILNNLYEFAIGIDINNSPKQLLHYRAEIINAVSNSDLKFALSVKNRKLGFIEKGKLDYYFRYSHLGIIKSLLDIIYEIDVYRSVSLTTQKYGFTYPTYVSESVCVEIKGLFHPFLEKPTSNDFSLDQDKNLAFITGPNSAGKSTYLKSLGIAVFLAHIGFPVPAKGMKTFVFNGMLSSINLSDNLGKGYSHFYSEVLRVKQAAEQINRIKNTVIIFDELFRGTNVKDAFEATTSVIDAFSKNKTSLFAISTHIIEAAEKLTDNKSIDFLHFEITINNREPEYTYTLKNGITNERIGMYILEKEKVIETIEQSISSN